MSEEAARSFLEEARRRGHLTQEQCDEALRIRATLRGVQVALPVDEIVLRKGWIDRAQADEVKRALAGFRVGKYEVLEQLGEGGAGIVWRARDTKLDRMVALKVLSQRAQHVERYRERFLREARVAVTLNHVNIVRGLEYGEGDGYHYFAMELVSGESVGDRLRRAGRIPEREAMEIALEVVRALEYVQRFGLVHRDIKPENLLLPPSGRVKVCDLGLAKPTLEEAAEIDADALAAGTPLYMSPEQIQHPDRVDWRSDVYGLGATLYHMLTGAPPFSGDGRTSVVHKHLTETPQNPREHVLELSAGASAVVLRMLQKEPSSRYASLADLAADLQAVADGRAPLHAVTISPRDSSRETAETGRRAPGFGVRATWRRRGRRHLRVLVPAAVLLLGGAGWAAWTWWDLRPAGEVASQPEAPAPPPDPAPPAPPPAVAPPVAPAGAPSPDRETEARLADLQAKLERAADRDLQERFGRARPAEEKGRIGAALRQFDDFPDIFADTAAARTAAAEAARLRDEGAGRLRAALHDVEEAVAARRFDDARRALEAAERLDLPAFQPEIARARGAVAETERLAARRREEQRPDYEALCGSALLLAGADGVPAARELVASRVPALDSYAVELSELSADLDALEAALAAPPAPEDRLPLAARGRFLRALASGDVAAARAAVEELRTLGANVERPSALAACVAAVQEERVAELLGRAETASSEGRAADAESLLREAVAYHPRGASARSALAAHLAGTGRAEQSVRMLEELAMEPGAPASVHLQLALILADPVGDAAAAERELRVFLDLAPEGAPARLEAEVRLEELVGRRNEAEVADLREKAKAAAKRRDREALEGAYGRIAELRPDDPDALFTLGEIYADTARSAPAAAALRKFVREHPSDRRSRKAEERLAALGAVAGAPEDDGRVAFSRARAALATGRTSDAIESFEDALAVAPYLTEARVGLASALLARAQVDGSRNDFASAEEAAAALLALAPDHVDALVLRARARLQMGDPRSALEDAEKAAELDTAAPLPPLLVGESLLAMAAPAKAVEAFTQAYRRRPSAEAMFGMARAHAAQARPAVARDLLETMSKRHGVPPALRDDFDRLMERLVREAGQ